MIRALTFIGLAALMQGCVSQEEFNAYKTSVDERLSGQSKYSTPEEGREFEAAVEKIAAEAVEIEGCYWVYDVSNPSPHIVKTDEFCIVQDTAGDYYFYPKSGLSGWGTSKIKLNLQSANLYRFEVTITGHDTAAHPSTCPDPTCVHQYFQINFLPHKKAKITGIGASKEQHGGTAHSIQ